MKAEDTIPENTVIALPPYGDKLDIRSELVTQATVFFKAGYEQRKSEEATVSLAEMCLEHRKAGQEEERKWWIKEATKVGILITKPEEQAGIAMEYRLQGINEVVGWINNTFNKAITLDQMRATTTYQTKLKDWGIK